MNNMTMCLAHLRFSKNCTATRVIVYINVFNALCGRAHQRLNEQFELICKKVSIQVEFSELNSKEM